MSDTVQPEDWTFVYAKGVPPFPFVEDENANITGLGHQDPEEFAAEINRYDEACNGEPFPEGEQWNADYITHRWALLSDDGERLHSVPMETPGAIAITTLWGQR